MRRYFGLFGFGAVLIHIVTSLMQLNGRFPAKWYINHIWGVIAALIATGIFLVLALTSSHWAFMKFGGKTWKRIQRVGYLALILALIHIAVVANARWQMWLAGKVAMPDSFAIFVFGVLILAIRVWAYIVDRGKNKYNEVSKTDTLHHGL